jgi:Na+/H+ antiporter NhaC
LDNEKGELSFYFGKFGNFIPLIVALIFIAIAAVNQAKIEGYVIAFFMAIVIGVLFAKNQKEYGEAIVNGLTKPMFAVIGLAVILASVGGSLVSKSGLIQTLAIYVINMGFTGRLFVAATFVITCIISFSTGTSVGTYFVIGPILYPVGCLVGADPAFLIGAIVAGAAFGDNLAPISDTTIASSQTQGMDIGGVVRSRMKYSLPVALVSFILYLLIGSTGEVSADLGKFSSMQASPITLLMLIVPVVIITLCLQRKHLITALAYGIISGLVMGLISGIFKPADFLAFPAAFQVKGLIVDSITGSLATVALLIVIFPLLGIMEKNGAIKDIAKSFGRFAKSRGGAEATIVGSVGLLSIITGVISVAILAVGELVNDLGKQFGIHGYRRANLMDCAGVTFGFIVPWTVHAIVPSMITSSVEIEGAVTIPPATIPFHNFYSWIMLVLLIIAVTTGYGRENKVDINEGVNVDQ